MFQARLDSSSVIKPIAILPEELSSLRKKPEETREELLLHDDHLKSVYVEKDIKENSTDKSSMRPLSPEKRFEDDPLVVSTPERHIYTINSKELIELLKVHYSTPLPNTEEFFPWAHGLKKENYMQRAFFAKGSSLERKMGHCDIGDCVDNDDALEDEELPYNETCLPKTFRGIVFVDVNSDHNHFERQIAGSINVHEILQRKQTTDNSLDAFSDIENYLPQFLDLDPPSKISIRNFYLQVSKMCRISDFVVYSSNPETAMSEIEIFAIKISQAQEKFRNDIEGNILRYKTYVIQPEEIALFSSPSSNPYFPVITLKLCGNSAVYNPLEKTGIVNNPLLKQDLISHERNEMSKMTQATPISTGIWLGNSMDCEFYNGLKFRWRNIEGSNEDFNKSVHYLNNRNWITFIDCRSNFRTQNKEFSVTLPQLDQYIRQAGQYLKQQLDIRDGKTIYIEKDIIKLNPITIKLPSTGMLTLQSIGEQEIFIIINICKLLYLRSLCHPYQKDGNVSETIPPFGALIFCDDGYTESSFMSLLFIIYTKKFRSSKAWLYLHINKNRPFYLFKNDYILICYLQEILIQYSPMNFMTRGWNSSQFNNFLSGANFNNLNLSLNELMSLPDNYTYNSQVEFDNYILNHEVHNGKGLSASPQPCLHPNVLRSPSNSGSSTQLYHNSLRSLSHSINTPISRSNSHSYSLSHTNSDTSSSSDSLSNPSEHSRSYSNASLIPYDDSWFFNNPLFDGNFPSKILPYIYLGSLKHAENFKMLKNLGVKRIISVGEKLSWVAAGGSRSNWNDNLSISHMDYEEYRAKIKYLNIDDFLDDGIDLITPHISECLDFINQSFEQKEIVLVHCRVGVSRSASIVICEVMKRFNMNLINAYLFVRVRRLNTIIQPNLKLFYELLRFEQGLKLSAENKAGENEKSILLRDIDWHILCREVSLLNKNYVVD